MWCYVYILENGNGKHYVGLTADLDDRLARHNRGEVSSTAKNAPWKLLQFSAFLSRKKAAEFEKYLKSGSGTEFRRRHF